MRFSRKYWRLSVLAVTCMFWVSSWSWADPAQINSIRRSIAQNNAQAGKLSAEATQLLLEKGRALAEMKGGMFCSGCNRTKTDIERSGDRFPHQGYHAVPATQEQLNAKAAEFDQRIAALRQQIAQLNRNSAELNSQGMRIQYEENMARAAAQREAARQQMEASRLKMQEQWDQLQKSLQETLSRQKQAKDDSIAKADNQRQADTLRQRQAELERQAARQYLDYQAIVQQGVSVPEALEDFKQSAIGRDPSALEKLARPLNVEQKAEQSRLEQLAGAGLAVAPPSFSLDGVKVVADKAVSVWNRAMDMKEGIEDVARAAKRVATNDIPNFAERVRLIGDNAMDSIKLSNNVLDQLPAASNAILTGEGREQARVQGALDKAVGDFSGSAKTRAAKASPTFDLLNSSASLFDTAKEASKPLEAFKDDAERLEAYKKAYESAKGVAESLSEKAVEASTRKDYSPSNANGWGPLGEKSSAYFQRGSYSAVNVSAPVKLYRVDKRVGNENLTYWSRSRPNNETVSIVVPVGEECYEGYAHDSAAEPVYVLKNVRAEWIEK